MDMCDTNDGGGFLNKSIYPNYGIYEDDSLFMDSSNSMISENNNTVSNNNNNNNNTNNTNNNNNNNSNTSEANSNGNNNNINSNGITYNHMMQQQIIFNNTNAPGGIIQQQQGSQIPLFAHPYPNYHPSLQQQQYYAGLTNGLYHYGTTPTTSPTPTVLNSSNNNVQYDESSHQQSTLFQKESKPNDEHIGFLSDQSATSHDLLKQQLQNNNNNGYNIQLFSSPPQSPLVNNKPPIPQSPTISSVDSNAVITATFVSQNNSRLQNSGDIQPPQNGFTLNQQPTNINNGSNSTPSSPLVNNVQSTNNTNTSPIYNQSIYYQTPFAVNIPNSTGAPTLASVPLAVNSNNNSSLNNSNNNSSNNLFNISSSTASTSTAGGDPMDSISNIPTHPLSGMPSIPSSLTSNTPSPFETFGLTSSISSSGGIPPPPQSSQPPPSQPSPSTTKKTKARKKTTSKNQSTENLGDLVAGEAGGSPSLRGYKKSNSFPILKRQCTSSSDSITPTMFDRSESGMLPQVKHEANPLSSSESSVDGTIFPMDSIDEISSSSELIPQPPSSTPLGNNPRGKKKKLRLVIKDQQQSPTSSPRLSSKSPSHSMLTPTLSGLSLSSSFGSPNPFNSPGSPGLLSRSTTSLVTSSLSKFELQDSTDGLSPPQLNSSTGGSISPNTTGGSQLPSTPSFFLNQEFVKKLKDTFVPTEFISSMVDTDLNTNTSSAISNSNGIKPTIQDNINQLLNVIQSMDESLKRNFSSSFSELSSDSTNFYRSPEYDAPVTELTFHKKLINFYLFRMMMLPNPNNNQIPMPPVLPTPISKSNSNSDSSLLTNSTSNLSVLFSPNISSSSQSILPPSPTFAPLSLSGSIDNMSPDLQHVADQTLSPPSGANFLELSENSQFMNTDKNTMSLTSSYHDLSNGFTNNSNNNNNNSLINSSPVVCTTASPVSPSSPNRHHQTTSHDLNDSINNSNNSNNQGAPIYQFQQQQQQHLYQQYQFHQQQQPSLYNSNDLVNPYFYNTAAIPYSINQNTTPLQNHPLFQRTNSNPSLNTLQNASTQSLVYTQSLPPAFLNNNNINNPITTQPPAENQAKQPTTKVKKERKKKQSQQ